MEVRAWTGRTHRQIPFGHWPLGCLFWLFSTTASSENLGTTLFGYAAIDRDVSAFAGSDESSTSPLPGKTSLVDEEESLDFRPRRLRPAGLVALWPLPDSAGVEYQPSTPALPISAAGSVPWPCNHQPPRGVALNASGAKTKNDARIVRPIFWGDVRINS